MTNRHRLYQRRAPRARFLFGLGTLSQMDRMTILRGAFGVLAVVLVSRLFWFQVVRHSFFEALASNQHELIQQLVPERGELYAKDRFAETGLALIATNQTLYHVYANTKQIMNPQSVGEQISPILGLEPDLVLSRVSKENDLYEPLKHQVTEQEVAALEVLVNEKKIDGIHWTEEEARWYAEGPLTSAITGFVGYVDDRKKGQYGLEGYFDHELTGTPGSLSAELDASGRFIAVGDKSIEEAQDGDTFILTIDKNIQYKACTALAKAVESHGAIQGSVVILDPSSGAILAMCNAPEYDPNHYGDVEDISYYMNDSIAHEYEPGSVFKSLTMAAAINEGKVTPYTTYEDTGEVIISDHKIHNSDFPKVHGVVDMTVVLQESLNTGAIFAVQQVGDERWHEYVKEFGFGKESGVTLSGENSGNISSVAKEHEIYSATSSYGQGLTVTLLQLAQAYAALANDGVMMKPYIVDQVVKSNGFQEVFEPEESGRPVSAETARTVAAMLVRVVDYGHSKKAAVDGYFMAGKTGTAQLPKASGVGYDKNRHIDTFVGFGPVSDPRFVIAIKIDEPKDVQWAEGSVVPVAGDVAQYLMNYLQIPPDRK